MQNEEVWSYITENYRLAQVGLVQQEGKPTPLYILLERGGSFNSSNLNQYLQNVEIERYQYEFSTGNREVMVART